MLGDSTKDRDKRNELPLVKKSNPEQVDNILLVININASVLSVQQIHNNMVKYVSTAESWQSKNFAFD